ncbi:MAG: protein kinase [Polyangiaceae bacterium]
MIRAPKSADLESSEESKPSTPAPAARRVGRYLLCDQIGSGGMATIHLARLLGPQGFSRTVAVKQLHPQFAQNPQFASMLLDEARLAVRIRHGNVISPLDIVHTDSELFIVMDYVNGESLAHLLVAADAPLRPSLAAAILVQVLLGLHAAHEATREQGEALELVHRDVSPQNILIGQDGVARMLDFGIAKAVARTQTTDGGMVKGKLGYMAPEQIKLGAIDRRTDLFSAGVVLWECLTGSGLFVSDTLGGSVELILHGEIAPPSRLNPLVTPELDAVVLKALARAPEARYQDALSMAAALEKATPLASALEVIDWVERLAGPELARRARLVRRAEMLSWEPAASADAPASKPSVVSSGARPGRSESAPVAAKPAVPRTPTLLGLPRLRDGQITRALAPTHVSTGVAVGSDRPAGAALEVTSRRSSKARVVAVGVAVVGTGALILAVFLALGERQQPLSVTRHSLAGEVVQARAASAPDSTGVAEPSAASSAAAPAVPSPSAPSPATVDSPLPAPAVTTARETAPIVAVRPAAAPSVDDDAPVAAATRSDAVRKRHKSASTKRQSTAAKKPAALPEASTSQAAPAADGASKRRASRANCSPPWVVNEQQVKVFKAECLR